MNSTISRSFPCTFILKTVAAGPTSNGIAVDTEDANFSPAYQAIKCILIVHAVAIMIFFSLPVLPH